MKQFLRTKKAFLLMTIALVIIAAIAIIVASTFGGLGIDSGLFDSEGCKAPCWHGLTPGQSTFKDVDDFLANLSAYQWAERDTFVLGAGCKSILIHENFGVRAVDFYAVDDHLIFIKSYHPKKISLGEIVDHFGDPEYFKAVLDIGVDYQFYILEVYYPHKGLGFEFMPDQEKGIDRIEPDMMVSTIHYFEPGDFSSYYLSRYSCFTEKAGVILGGQTEIENLLQEWSGFGKIDVIINDELHRE